MKQLLILWLVAASCTSQQSATEPTKEKASTHTDTAVVTKTMTGEKWKADDVTKKNVAAMQQVVNDSKYASRENGKELYARMQSGVDTLIAQCKMQGAAHEALHGWLEKVLKEMKDIKEEPEEYAEAYAALKKHINSFNDVFE